MANRLITKSSEWMTHIVKYYDNKVALKKGINNTTRLFLGLDISTSSTGYSLIDSNSIVIYFKRVGELKKLGVIEPLKDSSVYEIADNICTILDQEIVPDNKDV